MIAYIILHYRDFEITRKCLKSLKTSDEKIYVVINGEDKLAEDILEKEFPFIEKISLKKNTGFAGGMNKGIKKALKDGADWVMILNNDVECCENFCKETKKIISKFKESKIVFSPLIYDKDGEKVWFCGGKYSMLTGRARHIRPPKKVYDFKKKKSDYLTGCAMCFPGKVADDAGLMDEEYFLYWEDVDWSLKLKRNGYSLFVMPDIKINHIGSASTTLESRSYLYYYFRNHLRFLFKNGSCFLIPIPLIFFTINLMRIFFLWFFFYGREGRKKILSVLEGIKDFAFGIEGEKVFN